jgi:hypothetical protein
MRYQTLELLLSPFLFHSMLEKGAIERRVSCDNADIREIFISREIKSAESERFLGVNFQFNGKYSLMTKLNPKGLK